MNVDDRNAAKAVRAAERQLAYLQDWWSYLPETAKPAVLRAAVWNLTLCWVDNRLQAELRLKTVSDCMGVPVEELRALVGNRAEFLLRAHEAVRLHPDETKELLCQLMLS